MLHLTIAAPDSPAPHPPDISDPEATVWRDDDGAPVALGQTLSDRHWVHLPGVGAFGFARAGGVTAVPEAGTDPDLVEDAFRRMILPLALQAQGREVLHASAVRVPQGVVALCALSGTGKSTFACALSRRGHLLWADDAVCFELNPDTVEALPLPFSLRLRPESVAFLGDDAATRGVHTPREGAPLAAVFVLERSAAGPAALQRVARPDAFPAVLTHGYCFTTNDRDRTAAMVRNYLELVDRVSTFRLAFAEGLDRLDDLVEMVEGALE